MPKPTERERGSLALSILNRRKELGMTQIELSEATGIPQGGIAGIESGRNKNPTLDTMKAIAHALQTTVDGLIDGKHPKPKKRLKATA